MAVHVNFLNRIPLLAELPADLRERLAERMRLVSLPRRAVALEKGRVDQGLGFVLTGRLQGVDFTLDGREAGLYFVGPGDFYGELTVVDGLGAPEYVIALVKSDLLVLPCADARALLLSYPVAANALAKRLAARVRASISQRSVLALANPMQRLAAQLLLLAESGAEIAHAPTHQELAIMINTTRETVSRCFQALFAQGALARHGDTLIVKRREALQTILSGGNSAPSPPAPLPQAGEGSALTPGPPPASGRGE